MSQYPSKLPLPPLTVDADAIALDNAKWLERREAERERLARLECADERGLATVRVARGK